MCALGGLIGRDTSSLMGTGGWGSVHSSSYQGGAPLSGKAAQNGGHAAGGLMTPSTPGSGVVTRGWSSVTERLQALRVQLQSAQKKLASTAQVSSAGQLILR